MVMVAYNEGDLHESKQRSSWNGICSNIAEEQHNTNCELDTKWLKLKQLQ